jgi:hypothetical protein
MSAQIELFPVEGEDLRPLGWEGNRTTTEMAKLAVTQGATLRLAIKEAKDGYVELLQRSIAEIDAMIERGVDYSELPAIPKFEGLDCIVFSQNEILGRIRDYDVDRAYTVSLLSCV